MQVTLIDLGFNTFFQNEFLKLGTTTYLPARVISEYQGFYRVQNEFGEYLAEVSGHLRHNAINRSDFPSVGDWIFAQFLNGEKKCIIHGILPRKTKLSRKSPQKNIEEQILCSNVDTIFIVQPMDHTFNLNRIERYLTIGWESGAIPVVILSKKDLSKTPDSIILETEAIAIGTNVHALSSLTEEGLNVIDKYIKPGHTIAFIGQSGAGKSTLINKIGNKELQKINDTREKDSKGKHTTTNRELFVLDNGLLIDTPGLREIQLWGDSSILEDGFSDIEEIASTCRFKDCSHESEPGCEMQNAILQGKISEERFENYKKIKKEVEYLESKTSDSLKIQRKQKERQLHKTIRERINHKYGKK